MDLHERIMNIQVDPDKLNDAYDKPGSGIADAYRRGHRDARHAAAEMALAQDDMKELGTEMPQGIMPEDWQPIETAPRDGTEILGWNGHTYWITFWGKEWMRWEFKTVRQNGSWHPTHWQPLPDSPPPEKPKESTAATPEALAPKSTIQGMHGLHCCKVCGCRYGDEACPVVTGEVAQAVKCEDCEEDKRQRDEIIAKYEDPLRSYEVELGLQRESLTLTGLINSHRYSGKRWMQLENERQAAFQDACKEGLEDGRARENDCGYVSIERLRKMTVDEICAILSSGDAKEGDKP